MLSLGFGPAEPNVYLKPIYIDFRSNRIVADPPSPLALDWRELQSLPLPQWDWERTEWDRLCAEVEEAPPSKLRDEVLLRCDQAQNLAIFSSPGGEARNLLRIMTTSMYRDGSLPLTVAPLISWPPLRSTSKFEISGKSIINVDNTSNASARAQIRDVGKSGLKQTPSSQTYRRLDEVIRSRLRSRSYMSAGYFWTPIGYAMVTPLERFNEDGSAPKGVARWARQKDTASWNITDAARKVFAGEDGRYRLFVILVSDEPFAMSPYRASAQTVDQWEVTGLGTLPPRLARRPVTESTTVTVMVYEFRMSKGQIRELRANETDGLPVEKHLQWLGMTP
jgi:hypothetical protein